MTKESDTTETLFVLDQLTRFREETLDWALDNTRIKNLKTVASISELIVASCLASALRIPLDGFRVVSLDDLDKEVTEKVDLQDPVLFDLYKRAAGRAYRKALEIYGIVALRRDESNSLTKIAWD